MTTLTFSPKITFEVIDGDSSIPFDGLGDIVFPGNFDTVVLGLSGEASEHAEFDLSKFSVPPGQSIISATFQIQISSLQVGGLGGGFSGHPDSLGVFGYVGNGLANASDFEAGNLIKTLDTRSLVVGQVLTIDVTEFVKNLVASGDSFSGLAVRALDLGGLALARNPTLTITTDIVSPLSPVVGTKDDDILTGSSLAEQIFGLGGDDVVEGLDGDDFILGGDGKDIVNGGSGNDLIFGDAGGDNLAGNEGQDRIIGGDGDDIINGGRSDDTLSGEVGNDSISGGDGNDSLDGGLGEDEMTGGSGNDSLDGGLGEDEMTGGSGNDSLVGSAGNDSLFGEADNDKLYGDSGNDSLDGGAGADIMIGGDGNDTYYVDNPQDTIIEYAGYGRDTVITPISWQLELGKKLENLTLTGSNAINGTGNNASNAIIGNSAANVLSGSNGNDWLAGRRGNDRLLGENGNDTMYGGEGDDTLIGGRGLNFLTGGTGRDSFQLSLPVGSDFDTITDFNVADDKILISKAEFGLSQGVGVLDASAFHLGTTATTASVRFIYDQSTGNLFFDADGNGSAAQVRITQLSNKPDIANINISIADISTETAQPKTYTFYSPGVYEFGLNYFTGQDTDNNGFIDESELSVFYYDSRQYYQYVYEIRDVISFQYELGSDSVSFNIGGNGKTNLYGFGGLVAEFQLPDTIEQIIGTSASETLNGTASNDIIEGLDGNDKLYGNLGNDTLRGGTDHDILDGGVGADRLEGGTGNDIYFVDNLGDIIIEEANAGTDLVQAAISWQLGNHLENLVLTGTSTISGTGNTLNNVLIGNSAANVLSGEDGNDWLFGLAGNDTLNGSDGNDNLDGGTGNDTLIGGRGRDSLIGGAGKDSFQLSRPIADDFDKLTDFSVGDDKILISKAEFGLSQGLGVLDASVFRLGTSAVAAGDLFIYDQATGNLFFDPDGNGSTALVRIAQLSNRVALTDATITVIS